MSPDTRSISIPQDALPADGRFGSGPSKVRRETVARLAEASTTFLGTSHRRDPVRAVVRRIREGLAELFALPDGYEVLLGNGGTTAFWDAACFGLIERQSQHLAFGEFSEKFARAVRGAPHLEEPEVISAPYGSHPDPVPHDGVDLYALTHNETSTGVMMPVVRPAAAGLVAVDATSAAGGVQVAPEEFDVYYFAPQKCFASDGGLWLALCSPAALERIERVAASGRWIPPFLSLAVALENSRQDQTYNTPALATLLMLLDQVEWLLDHGGLPWAESRCRESAKVVYSWAEAHPHAHPFVSDPAKRSYTVATIDFDDTVDATTISAVLRRHGVVDTEPYRKLGRNQLRIALFPAIEPADVEALTRVIDYVIAELAR